MTDKPCPFCHGDRGFWHDHDPDTKDWNYCRWCAVDGKGTGKAQPTLAEVAERA